MPRLRPGLIPPPTHLLTKVRTRPAWIQGRGGAIRCHLTHNRITEGHVCGHFWKQSTQKLQPLKHQVTENAWTHDLRVTLGWINSIQCLPPFFFPYSTQDNTLHPWNGILIGGLIKIYEYWETRALKKKSKSCCNKSGKEVLRRDKVVFLDAALKDLRLWGRQFLFKSSTHFQWGLLEDSILIFNWGIIAL